LFDLAIHGKAYVGALAERWVFIKDGRIAKVSREPVGRSAATLELGRGQFLIPAATDLHVHLRDWSQSEKETVETGTKSAVAGGVTTVAEMPNTIPKLDTAELVERRANLLRDRSFADFAIHAAAPGETSEIPKMKKAGAFGLKLYPPDLHRFRTVLRSAEVSGLKVAVHAEEDGLLTLGDFDRAESVAVMKILDQVGPRSRVRFAHLSTCEAAQAVLASKRSHKGLEIEVAPHHLFMDERAASARLGAAARVNPRLRSRANSIAMRRLLEDGRFDFYATDHAPHTTDEKLTKGAPGFPGLEFALPLLLTKTRNLALVCRMYCEAPASYLGAKKGRIAPGYAADLVVMARRRWKIDPERFITKARVTPFAGEQMHYAVDHVFLRGSTAYHDGKFHRHPALLVT
jgi:dihydroorotase (multifunctional complex type)